MRQDVSVQSHKKEIYLTENLRVDSLFSLVYKPSLIVLLLRRVLPRVRSKTKKLRVREILFELTNKNNYLSNCVHK